MNDASTKAASVTAVGTATRRVTGRKKVTGQATYAAEFPIENVAYAALATSTAARGRIARIDTQAAEAAEGVIAVFTHENAPSLPYLDGRAAADPAVGQALRPLQSDQIYFSGQPVAVAVAETLEAAEYAASLVAVEYAGEDAQTSLEAAIEQGAAHPPEGNRAGEEVTGTDPQGVFDAAPVQVDSEGTIAPEHHHPMEPHATLAVWSGSRFRQRLTVYDKTQGVRPARTTLAHAFGLDAERVRVISPFVGGGFGSALRAWPHVVLAALAAREVGRPVKLVLTRAEMFTSVGHRPRTQQRVRIGADESGQIQSILHEANAETSVYEEFTEATLGPTRMMYAAPAIRTRYRVAPLNIQTPTYMRAPGEVSGMHALEVAMDELAYAANVDPVELRLRNHADQDPSSGKPFSSKYLKECYAMGAERFGWAERTPAPRSMREGQTLIGQGMATQTYPMNRIRAEAVARLHPDGTATVGSATADIGPGTYVAMTQVAADALGLPMEQVTFELGDSALPYAPLQGGSWTMASVGSAVQAACQAARQQLVEAATQDADSPLSGASPDAVQIDGGVMRTDGGGGSESIADFLTRRGEGSIEVTKESGPGDERSKYSMHSFGACFAEVGVDEDLGEIRVRRVVTINDVGRIVNPQTARSQAIGGVVGGIGMALLEETLMDDRFGRYANMNFAEYHVPVNADVPPIDAAFIGEPDLKANPLGVRGLGEIAMVGISAAIANAVYHATGTRIRDLPITLDRVLA